MPDLEKRVRKIEDKMTWLSGVAFVLTVAGFGIAWFANQVSDNVEQIMGGSVADTEIERIRTQAQKLSAVKLSSLHTPYSVLSQVQAQGACIGLLGFQHQLVTAVRRPRVDAHFRAREGSNGYVTCKSMCEKISAINKPDLPDRRSSTCYGGLHVYWDEKKIDKLGAPFVALGRQDTANPYHGLRTHVYKSNWCTKDNFGPNFCCCRVNN